MGITKNTSPLAANSDNSWELTRRAGRPTIATMDSRGNILRRTRVALGLTMKQLSERCGVDEGTISRLEAGKVPNVSAKVLGKVARGLGLSLNDLEEETESNADVALEPSPI